MKYAPPSYKHCTHCGGVITVRPLLQANARHAVLWSDGYVDSPMMPEQPLAARCPHCQQPIWLPALVDTQADLATSALEYQPFELEELWGLLDQSEGMDHSQLLYLRMKVWHGSNQRFRHDDSAAVEYSACELDNMQQLISLLDTEQAQDRVLVAELLREMGRFEEAAAVLDVQFHDLVQGIADQLMAQIEARNRRVFTCETPAQAMV